MPDVLLEVNVGLGLAVMFYLRDDRQIGLTVERNDVELVTLPLDIGTLEAVVAAWRKRVVERLRAESALTFRRLQAEQAEVARLLAEGRHE
jgi:hypothetical protein